MDCTHVNTRESLPHLCGEGLHHHHHDYHDPVRWRGRPGGKECLEVTRYYLI
ncbi:hypothetical protein E2C01_024831 [Portunus trituberculatus]|uniref:Uncharacterized protein n=1 Tax=Portunus trituberculatus TaxID=210409 RepID=A0A5B7EDG6_PORTR|nr:hypothetical protein [Portunus trituberculatus]